MRIYLTKNIFIEQCAYAPFAWDLYTVSKGIRKGEMKEVEKNVSSGLDLEFIAKKAAFYELDMTQEEKMNLEQFVEKFEKIQGEILKELKKNINQFKK
jgi:hypothetical protein